MKPNTSQLIISLFIVATLLLSGCNIGPNNDKPTSTIDQNFRTGTSGLTMKWVTDDMPNTIYDTSNGDEEISLLVELRNEGAESVDSPRFFLTGFDQNYVGLPYSSRYWEEDIEGRSIRNQEGGFRIIQIPSDSDTCGQLSCGRIQLPTGVPSYNPVFQLTACYLYKTVASPMICVDPDPYSTAMKKACTPETVEGISGSQGAPVALTSVNVQNIPGEVILKMEVSNVGGGRVFDKGSLDSCPNDFFHSQRNIVDFKVFFQNIDITEDCEPQGQVTLVNGKAVIYCEASITDTAKSAYKTPLKVEFEYGYTNTIEHSIEIKQLKTE